MSLKLNIYNNVDEKTKKYSSNMNLEKYLEFLISSMIYSNTERYYILSKDFKDCRYIKCQLDRKLLELPKWIRPKITKNSIRETVFENNNALFLINKPIQLSGRYFFGNSIAFFEGRYEPIDIMGNFTALNNYMTVTNTSISVITK